MIVLIVIRMGFMIAVPEDRPLRVRSTSKA